MKREHQFFEDLRSFANAMLLELRNAGLTHEFSVLDHVCYRVATTPEYATMKLELAECSSLLTESIVNGRPISCFELAEPILLDDGKQVSLLELPAPKSGSPYATGFEHVEVVTVRALEELMQKFPQLKFETGNLKALRNRDIAMRLPLGTVKFHEAPLSEIIRAELAVTEPAFSQALC